MQGRIEITVGIFVLAALGVFAYMGFQIGAFRFDRSRYNEYAIYFKDISGLSRKADVKIAGVKVGWVEAITLHSNGQPEAEAKIMVQNEYALYSDAYALVRQQGLLGPNYLEVIPGDPLMRRLEGGETLDKPTTKPVAMDELLLQFKKIATNVEDVTESFKAALGGTEGRDQLRHLFENLNHTAEKLSSFSDILERSFSRNEDNINDILALGKDLRRLAEKLETDMFPAFKDGFEKISHVFDRDFGRIADKLESTGDALEEASTQARDGLKSLTSVAEKIDDGKGLLGKLINEDETYKDLRVAVSGLKNYFAKVDRMQIVVDSHVETMHRPGEHYAFEDSKGYFDIRVHPNEDHFYVLQLASSDKGYIQRHEILRKYCDGNDNLVDLDRLNITDAEKLQLTYLQKLEFRNRNGIKIGAQFGKVFNDIALRFGLIEGFAGLGIDIDIPTGTDKFRWVTTLEAFDFTGQNRTNDRRPHIKWLNRMFLFRNIYFTFGADDFASKHNSNIFLGCGIRFGDDDIKFLLGGMGGGCGGGVTGFTSGGQLTSN